MGHQGDTISMNTHLKDLAKEREKRTKLITEIEKLAAEWRGQTSETKPEGGVEQRTILACVVGLMSLLSGKIGAQGGKLLSPCHQASLDFSRADGVNIGSCSVCGMWVRQNPRTRITEWLDNYHPRYEG